MKEKSDERTTQEYPNEKYGDHDETIPKAEFDKIVRRHREEMQSLQEKYEWAHLLDKNLLQLTENEACAGQSETLAHMSNKK